MKICNCTLPYTNPEACDYCSNNTDRRVTVGGVERAKTINKQDLDDLFEWVIDYTLKYNDYSLDDTEKSLKLKLHLPGVYKEDIKVKFTDTNLEITAKSSIFVPETNITYDLGFKPNKKGITVSYENGVLEITVAKPEKEVLEVEIK